MNKRKLVVVLLTLAMILSFVAGCQDAGTAEEPSQGAGQVSLADVNRFLNESAALGEGSKANAVAVIPYDHVDGPGNEDTFYAFVNFKYKARNFIKYQVSYIACTCRPAQVNYWNTLYIELTLPESGQMEDAEIRYMSYDVDPEGQYTGGLWGDSDPIPDGASYQDFTTEYIPYFQDKAYADVKDLSTMWDIDEGDYQAGDGREAYTIDTFSGSSVSANNMIRIINAMFEFHGTDEFFTGEAGEPTAVVEDEVKEESTTEEKEEAKEETTPETTGEKTVTQSGLPVPVDTSKTFKPSKDEEPKGCEEGNTSYECGSINKDNLIDYMGRDDVYYIDLRDATDYLPLHFRNFENIPFFGLIFDAEAGTSPDKPQLYSGSPKEPVPVYEESDELMEILFPKDKTLFVICQSGGRVSMLMDILKARGWDISNIYNVGGMGMYTDSKYDPYLVDVMELKLDDSYSIEGLTPVN